MAQDEAASGSLVPYNHYRANVTFTILEKMVEIKFGKSRITQIEAH